MDRDAVIVGIDSYEGSPLRGCVADAKDIADCLSLEQYDFNCKILLNRAATRDAVLSALGSLAYAETQRDMLVFYFAGHGQVLGDHGHLVMPRDSPFDPGISLAHLGQIMESASKIYRHVLIVLDCCHAGSAITWTNSRPLASRDIDREVQSQNESRCILAACRPEEEAKEGDHHGYFTAALIDGLLGDAVDFQGNVSVFGLHEYACRLIPPDVQVPVFKGDAAGTVILGTGFPPREGKPLASAELDKTLHKAKALVEEYYYVEQRENADMGHRSREGARTCAADLEPRLLWFRETQTALPDLRRNPEWNQLSDRMREYQGRLAAIVPTQVTRYGTVIDQLGHGGFGHVWRLRAPEGQDLAFKVFHGNELDDSLKARRFENGYSNMRTLDHPHIVKVHQLTTAPFGFLMDAIPGDNLREAYFDRDDAETCLRLLIDISETVRHAHGRKVLHRDIKPENIILVTSDTGYTPYLTDFDLAYHETNRTVTVMHGGGIGGVLNYAAPEQLYAPNTAAARAEAVDVFALGQLMYFVITGKDPAPGSPSKNNKVFRTRVNEWIEPRAGQTLLKLYEEATLDSPGERTSSVADFISPLTQAEAYHLAASGQEEISEDDFCERLGHVFAGLGNYSTDTDRVEMSSHSGQLSVIVRIRHRSIRKPLCIDVEVETSAMGNLPLPSFSSGASGRQTLNTRLDKVTAKHPRVTRRNGTKGAFQSFFELREVPLSLTGINDVCDLIRAVIGVIEQW